MKILNKIVNNEVDTYLKENKIQLAISFGAGFILSMLIFRMRNPHVITYFIRGV